MRTPDNVNTNEDVFPIYIRMVKECDRTRKTTATLRQNATAAFMNNMTRPASKIVCKLNLDPSNIKQQIAFIAAQTCY